MISSMNSYGSLSANQLLTLFGNTSPSTLSLSPVSSLSPASAPTTPGHAGPAIILTTSTSSAGFTEAVVRYQLDKGQAGENEQAMGNIVQTMLDTQASNNALTSQQISQALYSGQGVPSLNGPGDDTLQHEMGLLQTFGNELTTIVAQQTAWLAAGRPTQDSGGVDSAAFQNMTDAQVKSQIAESQATADNELSTASEVSQALSDGTLQIQKATDVSNLKFVDIQTYDIFGSGMTGGADISYNQAALDTSSDGTQHAFANVGGVQLYLSWNLGSGESTPS
jgi:hypothetical protein